MSGAAPGGDGSVGPPRRHGPGVSGKSSLRTTAPAGSDRPSVKDLAKTFAAEEATAAGLGSYSSSAPVESVLASARVSAPTLAREGPIPALKKKELPKTPDVASGKTPGESPPVTRKTKMPGAAAPISILPGSATAAISAHKSPRKVTPFPSSTSAPPLAEESSPVPRVASPIPTTMASATTHPPLVSSASSSTLAAEKSSTGSSIPAAAAPTTKRKPPAHIPRPSDSIDDLGLSSDTLMQTRKELQETFSKMKEKLVDDKKEKKTDETQGWGRLLYSADTVEAQLLTGNKVSERLSKVFEKYAKMHAQFGQDLIKLAEKEKEAILNHNPGDGLLSLHSSTLNIFSQIQAMGQIHIEHSSYLDQFVVPKMAGVSSELKFRCKDCQEEFKTYKIDIQSTLNGLAKSRTKSMRMLDAMEISEKKGSVEMDFAKYVSLAAGFAESRFFHGSSDPIERAYHTCTKYQESVDGSKNFIETIVTRKFPKLLRRMEDTELFRHHLSHIVFSDFAASLRNIAAQYKSFVDWLSKSVSEIDVTKDFELFATNCTPFADVEKYTVTYDLPVTLQSLELKLTPQQKAALGINGFANYPLSYYMESQKASRPDLYLPIQFLKLRAIVKKMGGFTVEGIFRLSANQKELDIYVDNVKQGKYEYKGLDPHVPASALKAWMRSMEHPLIPYSCYEDCVSPTFSAKDVPKVIAKMGAQELALLMAITEMSRQISDPVRVVSNKMSLSNLAVVFSRSVIRPEVEIKDVPKALAMSKAEVKATGLLLEGIKVDMSKMHLDFDGYNEGETSTSLASLKAATTDDDYSKVKPQFLREMTDDDLSPVKLPKDWDTMYDDDGYVYYYNTKTGVSQWEFPTA